MAKKHILLHYLKQRIFIIALLLLSALTYALLFYLYNVNVETVFYPTIICCFFWISFGVIDYIIFRKRHKSLELLQHSITVNLEQLPSPLDLIEEDYQELLEILHNDKLIQITKSDSRSEDLKEYTTLWAHQIKTPISAIHLLLQSQPEGYDSLLQSELFKIEQYVEIVLQYVRLDSSSHDLMFRKYSLDDILRQCFRKYARLFILKKLSLDFRETDTYIITDEKWFSFVIEQLLSNALKHTKEGKISIYVQDNHLHIEDTGIGIQAEDLPRVFEKGFTGYNGRSDKKSTGIGLYLCKRVISQLGHDISISSEPGVGTCVTIDLNTVDLQLE